MSKTLLFFWSLDDGLTGIGNTDLLDQPLTAFFASRQCSGVVIRAAMDWALEQAGEKIPAFRCATTWKPSTV